MNNCIHCFSPTSNPKFCSNSCSAFFNNKRRKRHGRPKNNCLVCHKLTESYKRKFCSISCSAFYRLKPAEYKRKVNAEKQSKYRQKKYREIHPTADRNLIKEFYKNTPDGYEVDHIIPLSGGGLHHQDNLQYLTKEENRRKSNKILVVGDDGTDPSSDRYEQPASP